MRKFYIFNINNEFAILNKEDSYELFRQMENIRGLDKEEFYNAIRIYETLAHTIDKQDLNSRIYDKHKESFYYTKYQNIHMINNYYKNEESKLTINNAYLLLETNILKPAFFNDLKNENYFACDFENKDYFWINSLYSS